MLKELVKLANELDRRGLAREASTIDELIAVAAQGSLPALPLPRARPQTIGEQVVTRNMWDQELWPGVKLWVEQYVKMMTPGGN